MYTIGHLLWSGNYSQVFDTPDSDDVVIKVSSVASEIIKEADNLRFIHERIDPRDIGCDIMRLIDSYHTDGKFINILSRVNGQPAETANLGQSWQARLWRELGRCLFTMEQAMLPFITEWVDQFGSDDELMDHLLDDKYAEVIEKTQDSETIQMVSSAAEYLMRSLTKARSRSLTHLDINPTNLMVHEDGSFVGFVDFAGFGYSNVSLSTYHLPLDPHIFNALCQTYESLWGIIDYGELYAAATIHAAWAPICESERGDIVDFDEARRYLNQCHTSFQDARAT